MDSLHGVNEERIGLGYGLAAYPVGLFPLYFTLFARSGAVEVVAHRALWSLIFCALLLTTLRQWGVLRAALADRRLALGLAVAGVLIVINWSTYVIAVLTGHTLETALGYFINPLAVAMLGIVVLGEAAAPTAVARHGPRRGLGARHDRRLRAGAVDSPDPGLQPHLLLGEEGGGPLGWRVAGLLAGRGTLARSPSPLATSVAGVGGGGVALRPAKARARHHRDRDRRPPPAVRRAARRVSMVTIAILQYVAPIGQFLLGWLVFHEPMPPMRWAGFVALVWAAVAVFVTDALVASRRTVIGLPSTVLPGRLSRCYR